MQKKKEEQEQKKFRLLEEGEKFKAKSKHVVDQAFENMITYQKNEKMVEIVQAAKENFLENINKEVIKVKESNKNRLNRMFDFLKEMN
jgi:hypothetical protein